LECIALLDKLHKRKTIGRVKKIVLDIKNNSNILNTPDTIQCDSFGPDHNSLTE
jgi:hypothetical protein